MDSSIVNSAHENTISPLSLLSSFKVTNCFDINKLKNTLLNATTESHLYTDGAFLVKHQDYYELFFAVSDNISLKERLTLLLSNSLILLPVKIVLIGKLPYIEKLSPIFLDMGFILQKRQTRVVLTYNVNKTVTKINKENIVDIDNIDKNITTELAKSTDVYDIFSVLSESFDFYKDNLPDVDEIADNISKHQVIVLKDSGKIIGCHYFEIKSNVYYGLFDCIKKEYKNRFLFHYLSRFLSKYFKSNNIKPIRYYGWRDLDNKRLMRYSKLHGEKPDGIYLYNFLFNPSGLSYGD